MRTTSDTAFDSWDYCIAFWEGAEEETHQAVQELTGRRHNHEEE